MRLCVVVCLSLLFAPSTAKQAQAPALKEPVIVTSLSALKEHKDTPEPKRWSPLPYPNNDDHEWVHHMKTLQKVIEEREKEMAVLQEQERKGQEERHKLLHMQKLLHVCLTRLRRCACVVVQAFFSPGFPLLFSWGLLTAPHRAWRRSTSRRWC